MHPGPYPPIYPGLPPLERERLGLPGPPHPGLDPNEQMVSLQQVFFSFSSSSPLAMHSIQYLSLSLFVAL